MSDRSERAEHVTERSFHELAPASFSDKPTQDENGVDLTLIRPVRGCDKTRV